MYFYALFIETSKSWQHYIIFNQTKYIIETVVTWWKTTQLLETWNHFFFTTHCSNYVFYSRLFFLIQCLCLFINSQYQGVLWWNNAQYSVISRSPLLTWVIFIGALNLYTIWTVDITDTDGFATAEMSRSSYIYMEWYHSYSSTINTRMDWEEIFAVLLVCGVFRRCFFY